MKRVVLLSVLALALAFGSAFAGAGKTHDVTAEVVSVDVAAKTITIKGADGEAKTAPVIGKAVDMLSSLKAGDSVTLTCKDNDKGEHEGVTAIKHIKVAAK
ncbi:MAG TPA: hypothetical protein VFB67_04735 [Candidatus Polarisedimenticolaceae bacterium]|nr:hypothetical protein [Candidatus Polarisedimenticolaceae bacterium]